MWRFGSARTALSGPNGPPTKTQAGDLGWRKRPVRSTIRIARQLLVVFLDESLEPVHDQNRVVRRACEYEQNGRTLCGLAILAMLGRHGQDARATRLSVAWPSWPCWPDTGKMPVPPDFTVSFLDNSLVSQRSQKELLHPLPGVFIGGLIVLHRRVPDLVCIG